jgi:t-SNARE complex subunit (syntaxin)
MLGRLTELRENSGVDCSPPPDDEKNPTPKEKNEEEPDHERLEFVEELQRLHNEILVDDSACVQACQEVRLRVGNMEEIAQLMREALLPSKISQLENRFEGQELVCQRMIRRAKDMLTTLRGEDQDYDEEDDHAYISLRPVRTAIARVRAREFKALVQAFFAARASIREEMLVRANRQLRFAYPDALEEDITEIMDFPELAVGAIGRRMEQGPEVSLEGILGELEGKKAGAQALEQGAKELKLMFLQFAELIDSQEGNLNAIEANIKTVMNETSEAIGILTDAEEEMRAYQRKRLKMFILAFVVILILVRHYLWPYIGPYVDPVWQNHLQWICSSTGLCTGKSAASGAAPAPPGGDATKAADKASSLELAMRSSSRQLHPHQSRQEAFRLAPESLPLRERHKPSSGFFARQAPLQNEPVLRSVAVAARGTFTTRHNHFRKPRQQFNSSAAVQ